MASKLEIKKMSITKLDTDCIVNAANSALQPGGGVCGAIFAEAGARELQVACNAFDGCPTGSAVLTPGFRLKAKYIIHAVGPRWQDGNHGEPELLFRCYQSALALALEKGCRSIAFPLISSGIFGYPKALAWQTAIRSILDFQNREAHCPDVIIAVLEDDALKLGTTVLWKCRNPQTHIQVNQMTAGRTAEGFYLLQSVSLRTTAAGKSFLSGAVSDRTGSIPVIFWGYDGPLSSQQDGRVVFISGQVAEFKGTLQITLDTLRLTRPEDSVSLDALVPVAPIDPDKMYREITALTDSLADPHYKAICETFLRRHGEALRSIPAAKSIHHSFLHGLLMHTGTMLKAAACLAELYPQVIDRSLLLAGTLLHDFSKREEFTFSELGLVTGYSVRGQLLGHLVMAAQEAAQIGRDLGVPEEKSLLLQHLLLSHHGKPEYGAAVVPMCAEADLLAMIDMMDSRMEIYRETLEQTPEGQFSDRVFALDGSRVFHHR